MIPKLARVLAAIGAIVVAASISSAEYTPDAHTVALYHFTNSGDDASGHGKHGTVTGATYVQGKFGFGLDFCGNTGCYFQVPIDPSLEPLTELTVEFWLKNRGGGSNNETVLRKAANCGAGYKVTLLGGTFGAALEGPNTCSGQFIQCQTNAQGHLNNWTHYALTYDPANGLRTYVNGVLTCTVPAEPFLLQHSGNLYIGASLEHAADGGVNGVIDEVRISDIARDPSEFEIVQNTAISVPANSGWVGSGVFFKQGCERFSIEASGQWVMDPQQPAVGPMGDIHFCPTCPVSPNHGALLARIGNNDPFLVGTAHGFRNSQAYLGELQFRINDEILFDNSGQLQVTIWAFPCNVAVEPQAADVSFDVAPNPSRNTALISLALAIEEAAQLRVYDVSGRLVRTIRAGLFPAGQSTIRWDLEDELGNPVPAGLYVVRFDRSGGTAVRRLIVTP